MVVMAPAKTAQGTRDVTAELAFLTRALNCANRSPGWLSGPGPSPGRTRSSWPPARSVKSPPASPTAARAASAPPGSRAANRWRDSTSTTPARWRPAPGRRRCRDAGRVSANAAGGAASGRTAGRRPRGAGCGVSPPRCGADLTAARTLGLAPGRPILAAQQFVNDIIAAGQAAAGIYEPSPQPAHAALADIRALAATILCASSPGNLAAVASRRSPRKPADTPARRARD